MKNVGKRPMVWFLISPSLSLHFPNLSLHMVSDSRNLLICSTSKTSQMWFRWWFHILFSWIGFVNSKFDIYEQSVVLFELICFFTLESLCTDFSLTSLQDSFHSHLDFGQGKRVSANLWAFNNSWAARAMPSQFLGGVENGWCWWVVAGDGWQMTPQKIPKMYLYCFGLFFRLLIVIIEFTEPFLCPQLERIIMNFIGFWISEFFSGQQTKTWEIYAKNIPFQTKERNPEVSPLGFTPGDHQVASANFSAQTSSANLVDFLENTLEWGVTKKPFWHLKKWIKKKLKNICNDIMIGG